MNKSETTAVIINAKRQKALTWNAIAAGSGMSHVFMSAIDFTMEIGRQPDPNGNRVKIDITGKF